MKQASTTIKILFLAAEAEPFVKVGGLGDVAGALPTALRALSNREVRYDVRLVLPLHRAIEAESLRLVASFPMPRGDSEIHVEVFAGTLGDMPVYFLGGDPIEANGTVYSADSALDAEKYACFSLAALALPHHIDWVPDILHANDWHTALAVFANLVRRTKDPEHRIASIISIHNLPFMGPDVSGILESYHLPLADADLPDWARVRPMPLGLWAADGIVAVSPTYAGEILHEEFGCGLTDFFRSRSDVLSGILNGLDTTAFDPKTDSALRSNFGAGTLQHRAPNKSALQERLGLPIDDATPMFGMVTRMDPQKGVDIALEGLRLLKAQDWQFVVLGTGTPELETLARALGEDLPDRVRVETRYDPALARQIYAGADMLLMPSRYEPCGLAQMIAMHYGCVPIVRAVGGLRDTVTDGDTGFAFADADAASFTEAVHRALEVWSDRTRWMKMQKAGMRLDFSWEASALQYAAQYQALVEGMADGAIGRAHPRE